MDLRMMQGRHLDVLAATTSAELLAEVVRFAERQDFKTVSAVAIAERSDGGDDFHGVANPPSSLTQFYDGLDVARVDPVMQHCKRSDAPLLWYLPDPTGPGTCCNPAPDHSQVVATHLIRRFRPLSRSTGPATVPSTVSPPTP